MEHVPASAATVAVVQFCCIVGYQTGRDIAQHRINRARQARFLYEVR
jgi:hypothetical protein